MNNKHYVVIPGNTDLNRGDQALVWESIRLVKEAGYDGDYYILSSGETEKEIYLQSRQTKELGYKIIKPILRHPKRSDKEEKEGHFYSKKQILVWGFRGLIEGLARILLFNRFTQKIGMFFLSSEQKKTFEIIKNADAVIVKGGGFIHSYGGIVSTYQIFYSLYHVILARKLNKPVLIMPNSFGPFDGPFVKWIVSYALKDCELITARETISSKQLSDVVKSEVPVFPDLGFFLQKNEDFDARKYLLRQGVPLGQKKCVGFTLRPYRFPSSKDPIQKYKSYVKTIKDFVLWLQKNNYYPVFIAQTLGPSNHEDDRIAIEEVVKTLGNDEYVIINNIDHNCKDLKSIYAELDYLIGTRFHSVIFAMSAGVPSIAIAYGGNKGEGITTDMELDDYVIRIENINLNELKNKFLLLVNNEFEIKSKIQKYMEFANRNRIILKEKIKEII